VTARATHRGRPIEYDPRTQEWLYSANRRPIRPLQAVLVRLVRAWCWL